MTASASDLTVRLDTPLPPSLPVGRGTAIFCLGACFHRRERLRGLDLLVDGEARRPTAWRMPRPDLFRLLHGGPLPVSPEDPHGHSYRSGFWATIPVPARRRPGTLELSLRARLAGGSELVAQLAQMEIVELAEPPPCAAVPERGGRDLIAICMATFDPDMRLFRAQVESLRAQTDRNWICLISDDCSPRARLDEIEQMVAGDPRFVVSRSSENLGPYRNFERALAMVPREAPLVALCDQDDRWHPDKLALLRRALGSAKLAYSDQRLVDAGGRLLRGTLWTGRRNNYTDLASLLIANTVPGAAALFRRDVAELALPFPDPPGLQFHDHWIGLVAMATGELAYVDRPLYDYVQHEGAIQGQAVVAGSRVPRRRRGLAGWRAAYFYGYIAREVQAQALLARCDARLSARKRRVLERFVAADRALLAFGWLAARTLRSLTGANETLGTETELAGGIAWRHSVRARVRTRETPGRRPVEAACPPLDASMLGERRLSRWRAGV